MKLSSSLKRLVLPLCVAGCALTLLIAALVASANPPTFATPSSGRGISLWERARDALVTRVNAVWAGTRTDLATAAPEAASPEQAVQSA